MHSTFTEGNVAVVTGGASGIGLEIARRLASLSMKVAIADLPGPALEAAAEIGLAVPTDVSDKDALKALKQRVEDQLGPVNALFNNAGIGGRSSVFDTYGTWQKVMDVNLGGIVNGTQVFGPDMVASGQPGLIVNTGSKQGITTPPGHPAYNVAKAAVKTFTEALQHELRNTEGSQTEARLFVPGFVFTPMTGGGRAEKPAGAWTAEQVVDYLLEALGRDEFYILCPDNDVDRATDDKRILWAAQDITENRAPLSRWHPDYADAFAAWMKE